jgi:NTP pyrophosphatase (non-canonical NTP hydrolase)
MHTLEQLNQQMVEHNSHRKHFERTPEEMASAIVEEAKELFTEIQTSLVTGEVWNVAGEIGDLYVLLAQLCSDLGIDPAHAFEMKALRNERKYGDWTMSNGYTSEEARRLSKESWAYQGGDVAFSHLYLDLLAEDEPKSPQEPLADTSDQVIAIALLPGLDHQP